MQPKPRTLWEAVVRLYENSGITLASAVAFSFIVSLFPFCILIGSLAGVVGGRELAQQAVALMVETLPARVAETLEPEVERIMGTSRFDLVTVSAGLALFFATGAIETLREALNTAYRTAETRRYPVCLAVSTLFVVISALSLLVLTAGLVVWPAIAARLEPDWLARPEAEWLRRWLTSSWLSAGTRYLLAGCVIAVQLFAMHIWLAAGRRSVREVWPGVVLTVLLWIATAAVFSTYLDLNDYTRFYGGLAQIMATLIFFWVSAVIVILGAELNRGLIVLKRMQAEDAALAQLALAEEAAAASKKP
jgi:membrane protein